MKEKVWIEGRGTEPKEEPTLEFEECYISPEDKERADNAEKEHEEAMRELASQILEGLLHAIQSEGVDETFALLTAHGVAREMSRMTQKKLIEESWLGHI